MKEEPVQGRDGRDKLSPLMSIQARLVVLILLVGTLPSLFAVLQTTSYMERLSIDSGKTAVEEMGKAAIYDQALTTAQEIASYLRLHPEVDLSDTATLESNAELSTLSVRPVGKTGYTVVFDANAITHFHVNPAMVGKDMSSLGDTLPEFWAIFGASLDGSAADGYYDWQDEDGLIRKKFMAIVPVQGTPLRVAATTYMDEFSQPGQVLAAELEQVTHLTRQRFIWSVAIMGVLSLTVGIYSSIHIARPLQEMAGAVTRVMAGEWDAVRPLRRRDELGALSQAFYALTQRVQELVEGLARRVQERTSGLQTVAEVSAAATTVLDPAALMRQTVELVRDRFGLYYVGLFLVDGERQFAVLRAGTGEAGAQMLERGHRLEVGGGSMIGRCVATGKADIQLDVGEAAVRFNNLLLPRTRSELALPLRSRGRTIGAMTVQSDQEAAFDEDNIALLQTLADQVGVAIDNAQLYSSAQTALAEMEVAQRRYMGQAWRSYLQRGVANSHDTRTADGGGDPAPEDEAALAEEIDRALRAADVTPLAGDGICEAKRSQYAALVAPVSVRGQVIGVLGVHDEDVERQWTPEERALVAAVVERMAIVADGLRLLDETQRREASERLVREITDKMRRAADMDSLIRITVQEVAAALGTADEASRTNADALSGSSLATGSEGSAEGRGGAGAFLQLSTPGSGSQGLRKQGLSQ